MSDTTHHVGTGKREPVPPRSPPSASHTAFAPSDALIATRILLNEAHRYHSHHNRRMPVADPATDVSSPKKAAGDGSRSDDATDTWPHHRVTQEDWRRFASLVDGSLNALGPDVTRDLLHRATLFHPLALPSSAVDEAGPDEALELSDMMHATMGAFNESRKAVLKESLARVFRNLNHL